MNEVEKRDGCWRGRFNVPWDDEIVLGFVESQSNIHSSLRLLVHDFVSSFGMVDRVSISSQQVIDEQVKTSGKQASQTKQKPVKQQEAKPVSRKVTQTMSDQPDMADLLNL